MAAIFQTEADFFTGNYSINKGYIYLISAIAALGGVLFGFDLVIISGTVSFFSKHFQLDERLVDGRQFHVGRLAPVVQKVHPPDRAHDAAGPRLCLAADQRRGPFAREFFDLEYESFAIA